MQIWVDADAVPVAVKEMLFRAANRAKVNVTFIANVNISVPSSPYIRAQRVEKGFDVADNEIARRADPADLVITADIPLAAEIVAKGAVALNPRGERYTADNVRQRLNMRDFMDTMRASGVQTGGPPPLSQADRQKFANVLDKYLARQAARRAQRQGDREER